MDEHYIEVRNESLFEPTDEKPDGDYHLDWGFISYDKAREKIVYRQFNTEGYVNQYILIDSLSNDSALVFETENSENFIPGGKARWTIRKLAPDNIETLFDLFIPGKGYTCMGINSLHKKNKHANQSMLH